LYGLLAEIRLVDGGGGVISRDQAHELIRRWAAAELGEIRRHWYPSMSPMLGEHVERRYRDSYVAVEADEDVLHCAGRAVRALQQRYPEDYCALREHYLEGGGLSSRRKSAVLDRFALVFSPET
jgi:hypothetical protein